MKRFLPELFEVVAMLTITTIAIERARSFYDIHHQQVVTKTFLITRFCLIWCLGTALVSPLSFFAESVSHNQRVICRTHWTILSESECRSHRWNNASFYKACGIPRRNLECQIPYNARQKAYYLSFLMLADVVPSILVISSYIFVLRRVKHAEKRISSFNNNIRKKVSESLEKTFMTFFLAVVLTLLPELFYQLLRIFNYPLGYNLCSTLRDIADCSIRLMPVFNAVFYSFMGSKFQKELKKTPIFRPLFPAENYPQHRKSLRSTMRTTIISNDEATVNNEEEPDSPLIIAKDSSKTNFRFSSIYQCSGNKLN